MATEAYGAKRRPVPLGPEARAAASSAEHGQYPLQHVLPPRLNASSHASAACPPPAGSIHEPPGPATSPGPGTTVPADAANAPDERRPAHQGGAWSRDGRNAARVHGYGEYDDGAAARGAEFTGELWGEGGGEY